MSINLVIGITMDDRFAQPFDAKGIGVHQHVDRHSDYNRCATVPEFHRTFPDLSVVPTTGQLYRRFLLLGNHSRQKSDVQPHEHTLQISTRRLIIINLRIGSAPELTRSIKSYFALVTKCRVAVSSWD